MKSEYIRDIDGNYLEIQSELDCQSFDMKMFSNNALLGFLKLIVRQVNGQYRYLYNVTGKNNLYETYGKRKMTADQLYKLIDGIKLVIEETKKYLINEAGIVFDPEKIFVDINDDKFYFIFYYDNNAEIWDGLRKLFEFVIGVLDHNDNEAVTLGYGVYKRLCTNQTTIEELFKVDKKRDNNLYEIKTIETPQKEILPEIRTNEIEVVDKRKIYFVYGGIGLCIVMMLLCMALLVVKGKAYFGILCIVSGVIGYMIYLWMTNNKSNMVKIETKDTVIPYVKENISISMPETTILNLDDNDSISLQWYENGILRTYVIEEETVIGSASELADLVIKQPGISRTHAKIIKQNERFFVKDMNSKNGTFNGSILLNTYQLSEIYKGSKIKLGNVEIMVI